MGRNRVMKVGEKLFDIQLGSEVHEMIIEFCKTSYLYLKVAKS